ncbi:hypothetical protein [uncultured Enterococcus sp.]|uniref:hypothetical protein n=1 Tax=uncultured Enterococcus sp. TaxID=167972 RepID=UPI0025DDB394|nr:hypothetical protein [uncultured Enterococcus sp.]
MKKKQGLVLLGIVLLGGSLAACTQKTQTEELQQTTSSTSHTRKTHKIKQTPVAPTVLDSSSTTTSSLDETITLLNDELAVAAYLDNYQAQHPELTLEQIIQEILTNPNFIMAHQDNLNSMVLVQSEQQLRNGDVASEVTISNDQVYARQFNGNELLKEQEYTKKELTDAYGRSLDQIREIIQLAQTHLADSNEQTSNEKNTVDGKNLTQEQVKEWIRNYLIQVEHMKPDMIMNRTTIEMSFSDGQLIINPRSIGVTNTSSLGFFKINASGQLEKQDVATGQYEVVSETPLLD